MAKYIKSDGDIFITPGSGNNVTVGGNFIITGTSTSVSSTDTTIVDNIIVLNSGESGAGVTLNTAGIQIDRGSDPDVLIQYNDTGAGVGIWQITNDGSTFESILTPTLSENLDTNIYSIVTLASNSPITLNPHGTGTIELEAATNVTGALDVTGNITGTITTAAQNSITTMTGLTTIDVGQLSLATNVLSSNTVNADIKLTPNGTGNVRMENTSGLRLPTGTTANQPTAEPGWLRFNTTLNNIEYCDNASSWQQFTGLASTIISVDNTSVSLTDTGADGLISFSVDGALLLTLDNTTTLADFQATPITTTGTITANSFSGAGGSLTGITPAAADIVAGSMVSGVNLYHTAIGTANNYKVLFSGTTGDVSGAFQTNIDTGTGAFTYNPSTDTLVVTNITGNASTATTATTATSATSATTATTATNVAASGVTAGSLISTVLPHMTGLATAGARKILFTNDVNPVASVNDNITFDSGTGEFTYDPSTNTLVVANTTTIASSAQYADLAENYVADQDYPSGTVMSFGGLYEVQQSNSDMDARIAGIVSDAPAYLMNSAQEGEFVIPLGLTGRLPCRVTGLINKGDMLVSAGNGSARAESNPVMGSVIGKALEDFTGQNGIIEVVVGRL